MKRFLSLSALLFVLLAPIAASAQSMDDGGWIEMQRASTEFELKDLEGRTLRSADLAGRLIVIDFWATWCGPCVKELPDLVEFFRSHEGSKDVFFLSASVTEDRDTVAAFAKKKAIPYPVYLADHLLAPFDAMVFPTKLIIDARSGSPGMIRYRREGFTLAADIDKKIEALRREPR